MVLDKERPLALPVESGGGRLDLLHGYHSGKKNILECFTSQRGTVVRKKFFLSSFYSRKKESESSQHSDAIR